MNMKKDKYGERFQDHLLEQYKLYVEMADRISERRLQTNKFYISLLTGLSTLLSIFISVKTFNQNVIFIIISLLGITLCILWHTNIWSYRQLNSGKFKVIHEMEHYLPFPCYEKEWKLLEGGKEKNMYLQLTKVERYIPLILAVPYFFLFFYTLTSLLISLICKN